MVVIDAVVAIIVINVLFLTKVDRSTSEHRISIVAKYKRNAGSRRR